MTWGHLEGITPTNSLNNRGEVVGESAYAVLCPEPGAGQITHAYVWRNGVKTDLGTFPGIDPLNELSAAWWINSNDSTRRIQQKEGVMEKLGVKRAVSLLFLALFASLFVPVFRLKRALAAAP